MFSSRPETMKSQRSCKPSMAISPEQRRAWHEGVERRPELLAVTVLLLEDLMLRPGDDQMRAGAQMIGELLDRRRRHDGVVRGGQHQDRLGGFQGVNGTPQAGGRPEK